MPLRRLHDFAKRWCEKPKQITGNATLHDFLDYLTFFCDAGGALVEETDEDDPVAALAPNEVGNVPTDDAVQLMTVHAAKGLEFPCVFVVRVASQSFPGQYKESLVEFPQQLRTRSERDETDPKTLHEQEERRLFYVAMTRAMNELYLCGKASKMKGTARAAQQIHARSGRRVKSLKEQLEFHRAATWPQIDQIHAAAEPLLNVSEWTQLPARANGKLLELSASAIQQYENCPLAYKLRYDWRLPEDASAALAVRQRHASGAESVLRWRARRPHAG